MLLITPISPNFKGLKCSVFGRFRALQSRNIYGETSLKERICFASNWGTQSMPVEKLIAQVEALPFSDDAKEHILYNNAKTFYEQL